MPVRKQELWCVAKKAYVKDKPDMKSKTLATVPFYRSVVVLGRQPVTNGYIHVETTGRKLVRGWVKLRGFSHEFITNCAGLSYINKTGKKIPTASAYRGKQTGNIEPGERVKMIAKVDDWCLTNKLWTKGKWLTKDTDICDQAAIDTLINNVVAQAARDFASSVKRIKDGKCRTDYGFMCTMIDLIDVAEWFLSEEYKTIYSHAINLEDPLAQLMKQAGVDKAWFKAQYKRYDELMATRNIYHPKKVKHRRSEL